MKTVRLNKGLRRRLSTILGLGLAVIGGGLCTGCVEELVALDALLSGYGGSDYYYYDYDDDYEDEYYEDEYYDDGLAGDLLSTHLGNYIEY